MNKVPRFMKEYRNYQRKCVEKSPMKKELKENGMKEIDRIIKSYERGFITIDEAMCLLSGN